MIGRRGSPLVPLFLTVFINLVGFGIIIPLLPLYAASFHASPTTIGMLLGSYSVVQMIATPYLGALSDRYGRRPILLWSQAGTFLAFILLGVAHSLPLLFVARILDGASGGSISTAQAYISDVTEERNRTRAYGVIGAAFGIGFVAGPALSGFLGRNGNYTAPIFAAAGISLVALVLTWLLVPESRPPERRSEVHTPRIIDIAGLSSAVRSGQLGLVLLMFFLFNFAQAGFYAMFTLFVGKRLGFGIREAGYVLAYAGLIGALVQGGAIGPIVRRWGDRRTMNSGLLLAASGLILSVFAPNLLALLGTITPLSIGLSLATPTLNSLLTQHSAADTVGRVLGLSQSMAALARVLGPIVAGLVFDVLGLQSPFLLGAGVLVGTWIIAQNLKAQGLADASPTAPQSPRPAG